MEYPLLGTEPLVVEFANTWYDDGAVDYLATPELVRGWFQAYGDLHTVDVDRVPARDATRVRELRDHIHRVLSAVADGEHPGPDAIAALNDCAALAYSSVQLSWPTGGQPAAATDSATSGTTRLLAALASEAIELAAGERRIGRCEGPGCRMLFVRMHGRRRFCHASCSQRGRQARYYRRTH
ncbi:CGNR zinc finger domain-containing protein [Kribbella sp. CA-247076]|uniref:CGNR zinc finger domain-containing protein n=1 Tax=Kribbella sp. CA-247076 TaxID=3239941 RepID=UPI003D8A2F96